MVYPIAIPFLLTLILQIIMLIKLRAAIDNVMNITQKQMSCAYQMKQVC